MFVLFKFWPSSISVNFFFNSCLFPSLAAWHQGENTLAYSNECVNNDATRFFTMLRYPNCDDVPETHVLREIAPFLTFISWNADWTCIMHEAKKMSEGASAFSVRYTPCLCAYGPNRHLHGQGGTWRRSPGALHAVPRSG